MKVWGLKKKKGGEDIKSERFEKKKKRKEKRKEKEKKKRKKK